LSGSEKNRFDIGGGSEKSRLATAGAQNDVSLPLHMLVDKPSTDQWLCQNIVFIAERHVYKHCSDVRMT